jgi:exopolysaccharide production protein ExoZ
MSSVTGLRQAVSRTAHDWFESPGGPTRLLPMEGLRGLAVLLVYFVHVHSFFGQYLTSCPLLYSASEYLGRVGNAGVDLFFVLSGFIIYSALMHKPVPYFSFLRRRINRIYPTFLATLSIYLVLSIVFRSESKIPAHSWAAAKYIVQNVLLLPGFFRIVPIVTVAWSLSFEFAFYISVPIVVLVLRHYSQDRLRRVALLSGLWGLFAISEAVMFHGSHIRMLSFLSGMLLQEISANEKVRAYLTARGQWVSAFAFLVTGIYHFIVQPKVFGTPGSGVISIALMSVAIFFFVLYSLDYPGALHKMCTWKPMRYGGNISYSYYLAHGVTLKGMATLLARLHPEHHPVVTYCAALVAGIAATWVSATLLYLFVEKPLSLTPKKERAGTDAAVLASFPWSLRRSRTVAETSAIQ